MSEVKVNKISPRTNCGTVTVGDSGDSVSVSAGVPVTVNGDLKSNALKATDGGSIISQSGTTVTIGASGDTVSLASGASQTGFGRTGTVDWQTTKKTASFTAVSGEGYFIDTSSSAITMTLPASPSAGDIVGLNDYARNFGTNNLTVARNGSNIQGSANNGTFSTDGQSAMFVYVDATQGWIPTEDQSTTMYGAKYITATGGTITTVCTNFKVHTFTGPGTFTVTCAGNSGGSNTVDYMVIAGGGGGGQGPSSPPENGGGGGAGGYRESSGAASGCYTRSPLGACVAALPVTAQGYPITVGGGGAGKSSPARGDTGSNSIFSTITSSGGGGGGTQSNSGLAGGSGGGGGTPSAGGGSGNSPPVSPAQGKDGGDGVAAGGGGGGGAGTAGTVGGPGGFGGVGGQGVTTSITGSSVGRAGGGAGGTCRGNPPLPVPDGGGASGIPAESGGTNTGGGGGAASPPRSNSGAGGSGIVVIRYKFQ